MLVTVSTESATPPYEQIRVQVRDAVASGALAPGAKLPPVRRLAEDLGLAVNTVARAYRELEADGVVETRGRNGTVVSPHGDATERAAQQAATAYVETVRRLGVADDHARALIDAALRT
ncbi:MULTISPECIES: GntR family transcriptional regulator [Microcella]|uniref:GntR family transcriptional regulator n=1 Tax=Microcella pacifica TaxID=2591847 RepID=A0A9E5JNQ4_9MICO|nr:MULTISPECIES: GntR family transcriptional regulator [Microcella]NHF62787.1 GntR family transcriptional regulator [Microcella pacifica]